MPGEPALGGPSAGQSGDWVHGAVFQAKGRAEQDQEVGKLSARLTTNNFRQPLWMEESAAVGEHQETMLKAGR